MSPPRTHSKSSVPRLQLSSKPQYVTLSIKENPFTVFRKIEQEYDKCFLFESLGDYSHLARYSIIGFGPVQTIRARGSRVTVGRRSYQRRNPYQALKDLMPREAITRDYAGGLVGYLGYDAANYFEPSLNLRTRSDFDQYVFGAYTDGLVFDKLTGELNYFYYDQSRLDEVTRILKTRLRKPKVRIKSHGDNTTKTEHAGMVEAAKEHIRAGDTFQCQIGLQREYSITGDPIAIYERLRSVNPSPFMFYQKFGEQLLIGASPELLFELRGRLMETYPLAGTIHRGKTEREDRALAKRLLSDPKEIAEHNMLVDLHRNDLGRVADSGTVNVHSLMDIKKFSHVQHISSEIIGQIRRDEDMFSAVAANFPAGTLSGAPKIESMKIIDSLEQAPRGPYGGGVGTFGFNGNGTFAIPIRTLFISGSHAFTAAAGGVVYDSTPEDEYQEIRNKLAAMEKALGA